MSSVLLWISARIWRSRHKVTLPNVTWKNNSRFIYTNALTIFSHQMVTGRRASRTIFSDFSWRNRSGRVWYFSSLRSIYCVFGVFYFFCVFLSSLLILINGINFHEFYTRQKWNGKERRFGEFVTLRVMPREAIYDFLNLARRPDVWNWVWKRALGKRLSTHTPAKWLLGVVIIVVN